MGEGVRNIQSDWAIDTLEAKMLEYPQIDCPLDHIFRPGLYIRRIKMAAGAVVTSKIHKTRHPFIITKGIAHVKVNDGEWETLEAPYIGITEPGTRRVLYIEEECEWVTFHATDKTTIEEIEEEIIEKHNNNMVSQLNVNQ